MKPCKNAQYRRDAEREMTRKALERCQTQYLEAARLEESRLFAEVAGMSSYYLPDGCTDEMCSTAPEWMEEPGEDDGIGEAVIVEDEEVTLP